MRCADCTDGKCGWCKGKGEVFLGPKRVHLDCKPCKGSGVCPHCKGKGKQ